MPTLALPATVPSRFLNSLRRFIPYWGYRRGANGHAARSESGAPARDASHSAAGSEWVTRAADACEAAAGGNLEVRILRCHVGGEVERLVHAINALLDRTEAFVREAGAPLEAANEQRFYRRVVLRGMLGSFRRTSELINRACEDMARGHNALSEAAENRRGLADQFEASVQNVVSSLVTSAGSVNAAAQELAKAAGSSDSAALPGPQAARAGASMQTKETSQTEAAHGLAKNERGQTLEQKRAGGSRPRELNAVVGELVEASQRIGGVVKLIAEIAAQTNLLALNATIEAARAGTAGKGFAVVATEIKALAQQTASATQDIKARIAGVQSATEGGIAEIGKVSQIILDVSAIVASIAAAIEEQATATKDIARNIAEASVGVNDANTRVAETSQVSREIAKDIVTVDQSAKDMASGSDQVRSSAGELSTVAESLKLTVSRFHVGTPVRA